ncbi:MAG: hypothetical protein H6Q60_370 [Oscillospiraceae bacterium]|nr:hypothetical protein [Oscillospiraceae bacterium]
MDAYITAFLLCALAGLACFAAAAKFHSRLAPLGTVLLLGAGVALTGSGTVMVLCLVFFVADRL